MIHITDPAQEHLSRLLLTQKSGTQIRIFISNPGTSSAECGISYCLPNTIKESDTKLDFKKISAYIDEISAPYLEDSEIDFITDQLGSKLTLKAPKANMHKLDTNTSLSTRINYVLQYHINPHLADHGGKVNLIKITSDGIAILKFGGGCNGCSRVKHTLRESIEKELLNRFPHELQGVQDLTEHERGIHSYY
ncbi:Fe-S biogenesis protein NfuA [Candidatus Profftia tarda]|uniref:Fe/S biogenesis protein NfuA n=1 Tax=Candidatus Profftia tarda TaxID=1177216 RepID=A0A8E4GHS3_9ENTR|nr:Fe-S biogenesis protein NfuA [Candidatus Profftia tarda]CAD6509548.1 Fe/S biogenesis protein NfuA [Candidatus Profftia tarda]